MDTGLYFSLRISESQNITFNVIKFTLKKALNALLQKRSARYLAQIRNPRRIRECTAQKREVNYPCRNHLLSEPSV